MMSYRHPLTILKAISPQLHVSPLSSLQHHRHYPSRQLEYRAATKILYPCLSLASLWRVPQLWFMFFISDSTVLLQVVFGRPCFLFPSGVQWIATLVMELTSLRSKCPIQRHRFPVMMVSISFCWHRAKRSRLEMVSYHLVLLQYLKTYLPTTRTKTTIMMITTTITKTYLPHI